ncbi:hypothetical protein ABPG75_006641 [Micractinium tetrahymenae]
MAQQTQQGILLLQNGVVPPRCTLPVPAPLPPPALPDPAAYAHLLPGVPPRAAEGSGFGQQVWGRALALCAEPGRDLSADLYDRVDDIIRGPIMDYYGDGRVPDDAQWAAWAEELRLRLRNHQFSQAAQLSEDIEAGQRCAACATPRPPLRCVACRRRAYCNAACQRQDWQGHKHACPCLAAAHQHA